MIGEFLEEFWVVKGVVNFFLFVQKNSIESITNLRILTSFVSGRGCLEAWPRFLGWFRIVAITNSFVGDCLWLYAIVSFF
jgi:hypothetical protein